MPRDPCGLPLFVCSIPGTSDQVMSKSSDLSIVWRKSSASAQGNCVEVAVTNSILVRDSKNTEGDFLSFSTVGWNTFLQFIVPEERRTSTN
ncbi:DUF397 domain-containing protein [Streptomyces sp. NPDC005760]|uniref:DUF397 domain-containing protein n=1 Tax=Streptomyces sp. NPDC005760 TaxID=3156718 RepID=UPI0033FAC1C7